jgi:hypothetical protein
MAFFGSDTLVAAGGSDTETITPSAGTNCIAPPFGKPHYDPDVLQVMYGEGRFTLTKYNRVKQGLLSIEELGLTQSELARLRCQDEAAPGTEYDPHHDPSLPPLITNVFAGVTAVFATGHRPTDKVHRVRLSADAAVVIPANTVVADVNFAELYEDDGENVAPNVVIENQTLAGPNFRAISVNAGWYQLLCVEGMNLGPNTTQVVAAVTTPARS